MIQNFKPRTPQEVSKEIVALIKRRYGESDMPEYMQEAINCLRPMGDMTSWKARHLSRSAVDLADDALDHLKKWQGAEARRLKAELKRIMEWDKLS